MKQSLELRIGQRLTMTPQLQHAIKLLQLSGIELLSEMQEALENNPLLEEKENSEEHADNPVSQNGESNPDTETDTVLKDVDTELTNDNVLNGAEEPGDIEWQDRFDSQFSGRSRNQFDSDDSFFEIDSRNSKPTTLNDHLLWQMHMTPFSESDQKIAHCIIDSLDNTGYLKASLDELLEIINYAETAIVEEDEVVAVLHQVQNFDPVGVAARDLGECLRIQLEHLGNDVEHLDAAKILVTDHLSKLASKDYNQLKKILQLTTQQLHDTIVLIQSLNPRPGSLVGSSQATYIVPDVIVRKINNRWHAMLNADAYPELRINRHYQSLIRRGEQSDDNKYLQNNLQEARWFIKSLKNRNETLLKVATAIIDRQQDFFEYGEEAMKPLVLHDIANELGMHESTISRATTQKYMMTPRGNFELKYFFSSCVTTADGGTCSATAIRSIIRKIVDNEPTTKPISDSKIVTLLKEKGINVARRTIAKYREHMNIPPSNQRKSLL